VSSIVIPRLIHHRGQARNGCYPSSGFVRRLVDATNHLHSFGHRQVYAKTWALGVDDSTSSTQTVARWRFRTGVGVERVAVLIAALPTTDRGGPINPYAEVDITVSGGATTTLGPFSTGVVAGTPDDAPEDHVLLEKVAAVTESTVYECALRLFDYARVLSVTVYELGAPDDLITHQPTAGSLIYDADRESLLANLSDMYRENGAINFHWSLKDGSARTRISATQINLIDNTTTGTPTAGTHPGWYIDPRYHRTASRSTVQFQFAAYASMSAGTGTVRLIDTGGSSGGTVTVNSATPGWFASSVFSIAESAEIYLAPQFAGDGAGTLSVYAVSLIEIDS
jgi:hypothetical protein